MTWRAIPGRPSSEENRRDRSLQLIEQHRRFDRFLRGAARGTRHADERFAKATADAEEELRVGPGRYCSPRQRDKDVYAEAPGFRPGPRETEERFRMCTEGLKCVLMTLTPNICQALAPGPGGAHRGDGDRTHRGAGHQVSRDPRAGHRQGRAVQARLKPVLKAPGDSA